MTWQTRFDSLLKAMASGEPPKRKGEEQKESGPDKRGANPSR